MAFALDVQLQPVAQLDALAQFTALLNAAEPRVRKRFAEAILLARQENDLAELERVAGLVETGQIDEALRAADAVAPALSTTLEAVYSSFGMSAAHVFRSQVDTTFDFNSLNTRAQRAMQANRAELIREFTQEQRGATTELLSNGFARGLAPIEQARELKRSIGLTTKQAQAVTNYRRLLSEGSAESLNRALRDKRFDRTVARSLASRGAARIPLTPTQIDAMVKRYSERSIAHRAETIALTETRRAAGAADVELWTQAVESGEIAAEDVVGVWHVRRDGRQRDSHDFMQGQERQLGETFTSGSGNALLYPGDPGAPGSETIRCRCVVAREVRESARADTSQRTAVPKIEQVTPPPAVPVTLAKYPRGTDSLATYRDRNGPFTPERQKLHESIIAKTMKGARKQKNPVFHMLGGGSGAGKSSLNKYGLGKLPKNIVKIDSDEIKNFLPEFQEMIAAGDERAAAWVHEESSYLAKEITRRSRDRRFNVLLDGTGDSDLQGLQGKITPFRNLGMKVKANYVTIPTEEAVSRAILRGQESGRVVPTTAIREIHRAVSRVFQDGVRNNLWDDVVLWDNNVPKNTPPRMLFEMHNGVQTIHDPVGYQSFLAKGNEIIETDAIATGGL